jgi:hypothetical protein
MWIYFLDEEVDGYHLVDKLIRPVFVYKKKGYYRVIGELPPSGFGKLDIG